MQCSHDDKGNSVPTILLMMQERLYIEGGLKVCLCSYFASKEIYLQSAACHFYIKKKKTSIGTATRHSCSKLRLFFAVFASKAEGIFRINAENGREEYVRNQLNKGVVPRGIEVHCLAGLIKVCHMTC
jgi:hypothetical protein